MEGALVVLALLACPVGMGVMMWFMARSSKKDEQEPVPSLSREELRAEQERIVARIDQVEGQPGTSDGRLTPR